MNYKTIILAGLLKDIGKFLKGGSFNGLNATGNYNEISHAFVKLFEKQLGKICNVGLLKDLVLIQDMSGGLSGEIQSYVCLVNRANMYSSLEQDENSRQYTGNGFRALDSVISRLDIGKGSSQISRYKHDTYSPQNIFPTSIQKLAEENINAVSKSFEAEINAIMSNITDFNKFYLQLYSILLKHTWCIPSNVSEGIADISLFDHLKTTSAICACLFKYHEAVRDFSLEEIEDDKNKKFVILVGDLSGIQSYIFEGINMTTGSAAKKLRARSFSIGMLSELAAKKIIDNFDLPLSSILMSSGGKIYILLPNSSSIKEQMKALQHGIDKYLLEEFEGQIAFNMAYEEISGEELSKFGQVISNIGRKLAVKKKCAFSQNIVSEGKWIEDEFVFDKNNDKGFGICRGCGREFRINNDENMPYGNRCLKEIDIGTQIPRLIGYEFLQSGSGHINFADDLSIRLIKDLKDVIENRCVVILGESRIKTEIAMITKYIANYIPADAGRVLNFDEIASKSKGVKYLGYLKADLDSLGSLFAFGLRSSNIGAEKRYDSVSRITTLSRMLDIFFSGRINQIIMERFKNCYIVYSGGDDLLIIGPWNELLEFAVVLNHEIRLFTGNNPNITLSAGISFAKPKTPVSKPVERAEELLEMSKETVLRGNSNNRNQISAFNSTLSWEDFKRVIEDGKKLEGWYRQGYMTKGDLYKLKNYDSLYQSYWKDGRVEGLKYKPFIAYDIGRKIKENKINSEVRQWMESLFDMANPSLVNLGAVVDYTLMSIREVN